MRIYNTYYYYCDNFDRDAGVLIVLPIVSVLCVLQPTQLYAQTNNILLFSRKRRVLHLTFEHNTRALCVFIRTYFGPNVYLKIVYKKR